MNRGIALARTKERRTIIAEIQKLRDSKVIVYFTGDRRATPPAQIAEDAVRPLYDHLSFPKDFPKDKKKRIDLFIYSRGGDVSVPWRIVSMIRQFCDEFRVLVPYKAYSAATLLSLGADDIYMGHKAELGPIDPKLTITELGETGVSQKEIGVEDVNSYISFVREKANISDQSALAQLVSILAKEITPQTLGQVYRQNSHIRLVARKLLTCGAQELSEQRLTSVIETLTEKIYSHGHAIGRTEAADIGLPIEDLDEKLEAAIWSLYLEYEDLLKLNEPVDITGALAGQEQAQLGDDVTPIAIIESEHKTNAFLARFNVRRNRNIPDNPQINLNLVLSLPADVRIDQLPAESQRILQHMLTQATQQMQIQVRQEIMRQSPEKGISLNTQGKWEVVS